MIGQVVQTAPPAFGIPGFFASIRFLLTRWDIFDKIRIACIYGSNVKLRAECWEELLLDRNIDIAADLNGNKVVVINDIIFKGKRNVQWKEVEQYLRQYIGKFYEIADTKEIIYISADFPDEYSNSNYTHHLKGASAKAKANAAQGLPEMIEVATGKQFQENRKLKHSKDAKFGWYRYEARFALPVFGENEDIERYNIFHVLMLMRHAKDGKIYLYDIVEIKKETSNLFQSNDFTQ